jgi:hypothetical protein
VKRTLARFRVDPSRVRVAIRPDGAEWLATISSRETGRRVEVRAKAPRNAVVKALHTAEAAGLGGVDLGMQSAYVHPWGTGTRCGSEFH